MTKKLFTVMMCALVLVSCGQDSAKKRSRAAAADTDDMTEEIMDDDDDDDDNDELTTKQLAYSFDEDKVEVSLSVDYPTDGPDQLVNAIREFVSETLGGTYEGSLKQGKQLVDYYGQQLKTELMEESASQREEIEDENYINGFYKKYIISLAYETDRLVTYTVNEEIYLNGAHGVEYFYGQTFRKNDGRRFGHDMMRDLYTDGMYSLVKEGLRAYFNEVGGEGLGTDEELKEYIITDDNVDYLPQPRHAPFVMSDGVRFVYQPYEISFYAAGMPQFTLSLQQIKPYLTVTAKRMLER